MALALDDVPAGIIGVPAKPFPADLDRLVQHTGLAVGVGEGGEDVAVRGTLVLAKERLQLGVCFCRVRGHVESGTGQSGSVFRLAF